MDRYGIDNHKMMYHVSRLADWSEGQNIYPIYAEISPSGACNHRCSFCALDYMGYQKRFLDTSLLQERLAEMESLGLKSVMYAGEGEPLLHRQIADIIRHTEKSGIDVALTTNGVLFDRHQAHEILPNTTWIKVSINGGTKKTYAKIHRTRESHFDDVISNMSQAAEIKQRHRCDCTLGFQLLLLPENRNEVENLAKLARDIGMDYLVIKPYSHHLSSNNREYRDLKYGNDLDLAETLSSYDDATFSIIFRSRTMENWDRGSHDYKHCLALPFWSYIDAGGNVWGCSAYLGDDSFLYGNLYHNTFKEIWNDHRRQSSLRWVTDQLDPRQCRVNCRMDKINRYLWELKNPPEHVNFI